MEHWKWGEKRQIIQKDAGRDGDSLRENEKEKTRERKGGRQERESERCGMEGIEGEGGGREGTKGREKARREEVF